MRRTSLRSVLLLATLSLALAACGGKPTAGGPSPKVSASIDPKNINTPYSAIAAGKVDIEGGLVDIASRAPGIIQSVMVQEGDNVKKDQLLAQQEDEDARLQRNRVAAALAQAEAQIPILEVQLEAAKREQARLERLIADKAAPQQAYDQASDTARQLAAQLTAQHAAVDLARAQLREADYQVELYKVRAPTDGVIVRRYANPGMGASTLQVTPLFQLQPTAQRIVRAEVEERSLNQVKPGQKVEIVPEAEQDKAYPGTVMRIAAVMGSRKLLSDDPSQKQDERVVEVVVDAEKANVLVGQRVLVKFLKDAAPSSAGAAAPAANTGAPG